MLVWLLDRLATQLPSTAWSGYPTLLEKSTFRGLSAAVVAFVLAVVLGPRMIAWLRRRFREPVKSDSPEIRRLHRHKQSTPTMGGLFLVAGLLGAVLAFGNLSNGYLQAAVVTAVGLLVVGLVDDLAKLRGESDGISARTKLVGQTVVALVAVLIVYHRHAQLPDGLVLHLPLLETTHALGLWFVPLAVLVIVGTSNAVNLTDGLDGLAGGCLIFAVGGMAVAAHAAGSAELTGVLRVGGIPGAEEMVVLAGAMLGGVLGFLWFNCHPAQVFLGDTGSLPLGGLLGLLAVVARQEFLLVVVGGVFVVEAASVIVQVGYYKWRRQRILLCAPLHHHFQFKGWPETRIVVRFWIAAALCAGVGLAGLRAGGIETAGEQPSSVTAMENVGDLGRSDSNGQ